MSYGTRMKLWRTRLRLSQHEVSRWLGMRRHNVTLVENGVVTPATRRAAELMEALYRDVELRGQQGIGLKAIKETWTR